MLLFNCKLNCIPILLGFLMFFSCEKSEKYKSDDLMELGVKLTIPTPNPEKYFDDLIHPCVRYIEGGFGGHDWWMVATPFRGNDDSIENPILFYGDSRDGGLPPVEWFASAIVEDTPSQGYNSDGAIFIEQDKLWVFWRENHTQDCYSSNYKRATFGRSTVDGFSFSEKKVFAGEKSLVKDSELCPIILKRDGMISLYGAHYEFKPRRQSHGLAVWNLDGDNLESSKFEMNQIGNLDCPPGFKFWHFDIFFYSDKYYCVATPEKADAIYFGISIDGVNFKFASRPLLSSGGTGRTYFYKPSALVKDGIFYLWHPVAEKGIKPRTSRIWMSRINFNELLDKLNTDTFF